MTQGHGKSAVVWKEEAGIRASIVTCGLLSSFVCDKPAVVVSDRPVVQSSLLIDRLGSRVSSM